MCDDQRFVLQVLQEITSVWDAKRGRATDGPSPAKRRSTSGSGAPSEAERRKSRENEMAEIADIDGTMSPVDGQQVLTVSLSRPAGVLHAGPRCPGGGQRLGGGEPRLVP